MKQIAITGGKGGVGKSTFSALLAGKLVREGKKVVLCDCDVECPNDHLLLGVGLDSSVDKVYAQFPKLVEDKCKGCGLCAEKCASNAVFMPRTTSGSGQASEGARPVFIHELCSGCGLCWNICPYNAIEVEKKEIGEIFVNKLSFSAFHPDESQDLDCASQIPYRVHRRAGQGRNDVNLSDVYLVTGRSVGIVDETGPIVEEVRKFAIDYAKETEADYLLLDTAPGLHCAVIRALWEVDKAYAVTEPTPLGAHDLELILQLLAKLEIPAEVVLNQSDLGDRSRVDEVVNNYKVSVSCEIPYSRAVVWAYSKGELLDLDSSLLNQQ